MEGEQEAQEKPQEKDKIKQNLLSGKKQKGNSVSKRKISQGVAAG